MLESIGLIIILATAIVLVVAVRAGRVPPGLIRVFSGSERTDDDPVRLAARAVVAGSEKLGGMLYLPRYLAVRLPATLATMVRGNPYQFCEAVATMVNELLVKRARRENIQVPTVDGSGLQLSVSTGALAVRVSADEWKQEPFAAPVVGQQFGRKLRDDAGLIPELKDTAPGPTVPASGGVPPTIDPRQVPSHSITTTLPSHADIETIVPQTNDTFTVRWGRHPSSDVVLPREAGLSENHLEITSLGGFLYAIDKSTHGTWVDAGTGWKALARSEPMRLVSGARLSLNERRTVIVQVDVLP